MKAVVILALLGVAAAVASPLYVYVKKVGSDEYMMVSLDDYKTKYSGDYKLIAKPHGYTSPVTYSYPTFGNVPFPYSFPYTFPFTYPMVAKPGYDAKATVKAKRSAEPEYPYDEPSWAKRSAVADPEAKADPAYVYTVVPSTIPYTGTTTYKFPSGFPAASPYSGFPVASPYSAFPVASPYSAFPYSQPFSFPYSFPYPLVASPKVYKAKQEAESVKEKTY